MATHERITIHMRGIASISCFALCLTLAPFVLAQPTPIPGSIGGLDPGLPEICGSAGNGETVMLTTAGDFSTPISLYWTASGLEDKQVIVIVNGNGFRTPDYEELAFHLATQGFIAAIALRPNNGDGGTGASVLDAIQTIFDELQLSQDDPELRLALLGHSRGGALVVDAAVRNRVEDRGFPIRAIVGLAPLTSDGARLEGEHTGSYLTIYGSQDEDLEGFGDTVKEAFRAYDDAGDEGTTACNFPPCILATPLLERTMVYVYGADHAGLIGVADSMIDTIPLQDLEYIDATDQLCIVETYVTGFLRWKLRGQNVFKGLVRDTWRPKSIHNITTFEEDGFGNPAGADLRMFFQISPASRRVIQNFETDLGEISTSGSLTTQHAGPGEFSGSPFYIRHNTGLALVGWEADGTVKSVRWRVPSNSRVSSTYTHLAIRLGQLEQATQPYENPVNADQEATLAVVDASGFFSFHDIEGIPAPDRYTDGTLKARSAMHTVRIPVAEIDLSHPDEVSDIYLFFPAFTSGTLLVDSIEWQRD